MEILFNDEVVFYIAPNVSFSIDIYQIYQRVQAKDGVNMLKIRNLGLNDCYGFKIANVTLNRETNGLLETTLSSLFQF